MKNSLWTRDITLMLAATALGAAGGIAGGFALSFLVFDETGSTFASALIIAIQLVPQFILPLAAAPVMDRLPRKPFLVFGDVVNGVLYTLMGVYLMFFRFSYVGYLCFSLLLSSLSSFDELAYDSIFPKLIPRGMEQQGYAVLSMLYPVLKVVMTPLAAILLDTIGCAWLLVIQGSLSFLAAFTEAHIRITEENRMSGRSYSLAMWRGDIKQAAEYLRRERGLMSIYSYMAATNGAASGYSPIMIAFFRMAPGLSAAMYSLLSAAEFIGRSAGGAVQYRIRIAKEKKFGFAFFVYQLYELMDMCLLWLPYPLMLANRALCGFLGINSAAMRQAAVQRYIPEQLRARVNAFFSMLMTAASSMMSLAVGALGEIMDCRLCVTLCSAAVLSFCWLTVWRNRRDVKKVYELSGE